MPKNIEIEVKYKVNSLPQDLPVPYQFKQIYFDGSKVENILKEIFPTLDLSYINTFRVREINYQTKTYVVTLKTKSIGYSRGEFEEEISEEVFQKLIENNILSEIDKNRYVINKNGFQFEFDEYLNLKIDLITCEVELEEINQTSLELIEKTFKEDFQLEYTNVTDDHRYKNSNLSYYLGK